MAQTIKGIFTADELHEQGQYFSPCQLRPFDIGCPKPLTPHHCVPDHCFVKIPEKKKKKIVVTPEERIKIDYTPPPLPPPPPPQKTEMTNGEGLCICVDGTGKADEPCDDGKVEYSNEDGMANLWPNRKDDTTTKAKSDYHNAKTGTKEDLRDASKALESRYKELNKQHSPNSKRTHIKGADFGYNDKTKSWDPNGGKSGTRSDYYDALGTHGKIHHLFDAAEDELAELNKKATPSLGENVATLSQLENLAATVIAKVTGCDAKDLKRQMRSYHNSKGICGETLLRARAKGGAPAKPDHPNALGQPTYLSKEQRKEAADGVNAFLNDSYTGVGI